MQGWHVADHRIELGFHKLLSIIVAWLIDRGVASLMLGKVTNRI